MKKILLISVLVSLSGAQSFAQSPPPVTIEAYDIMGNPLGNNPTICESQSIDFYVQAPYESTEPKTFKWKKNGVVQLAQAGTNPLPPAITWNSSTLNSGDVITLTVTFTAPPPFYSPDSVTSQNITFTVTPNQPPTVTISDNLPPSDTICHGNTVTFTANPVDAGTPSYEWRLDGGIVGFTSTYTTSPSLASGNHLVYCFITSSESCDSQDPVYNPVVYSDTTFFYVETCTSVEEQNQALSSITVSPNPVTDQFTIYDAGFTVSKIEILNILGKKVFEKRPSSNVQHLTLDVSTFTPGIYFVKVKGEKGESVTRFVKE